MKVFTKYILASLLIVAMGTLMNSCSSNDDNFEKGPVISSDNIGAYFPSTNKSVIIRADEDEKVIDVKVSRTITDKAVTIPIKVVSKTDNMTIPSSVTFNAGCKDTTIQMTYTDLSITPKCEIMIDTDYGNPYLIKDGSTHYGMSVYKANLISNSIQVTAYKASDTDYFKNVTGQAIYQLGKDNRFMWKNFLGSGIDLQFKLSGTFDADNLEKCNGTVIPLNHYQGESTEYGWYLMNTESDNALSEDYATWTPEGSTVGGITDWIYFYYDYQGTQYFTLDFSKNEGNGYTYSWGWIGSSVINRSGNYNNYYIYIYY